MIFPHKTQKESLICYLAPLHDSIFFWDVVSKQFVIMGYIDRKKFKIFLEKTKKVYGRALQYFVNVIL